MEKVFNDQIVEKAIFGEFDTNQKVIAEIRQIVEGVESLRWKDGNEALHLIQKLSASAIENSFDARMKDSPSNSPIGCLHWYRHLLGSIASIGDFIRDTDNVLDDAKREKWGKQLSEYARHLADNYNAIPFSNDYF